MNREEIHQEVLGSLLELVADGNAARIRVVSRLFNDEFVGGDAVEPLLVFVPDLHLLSRAGDEDYPYGFRRVDAARRVERGTLLVALLDKLLELEGVVGADSMQTVQLGDFVDLWRENERARDGLEALVDRIVVDNADVYAKLVRRTQLGANVVVGNHDEKGPECASLRRARMSWPFMIGATKPTLLALHGHLYDPLEQGLASELKEFLVERFGSLASANSYLVDRTAGGQTAELGGSEGAAPRVVSTLADGLGLPDWINLWFTVAPRDAGRLTESHSLLPDALEFADAVRAGKKRTLAAAELESALPELRTIVMGHSHFPRISVHRDSTDSSQDLVLMDCGAWIENSQFAADDRVPSCNLGVLCGGDARIYQIDPHPSLYGAW